MEPIDFTIDKAGKRHQLKLLLDPEEYAQKLMLAEIRAGQPYEPQVTYFAALHAGVGDVFIDVGAHIGYFSLLAGALVGSSGQVWSFEPNRDNYARLLQHLKLNGLDWVRPFNWAVGAECRMTELFMNLDNDGGHALWNPGTLISNERTRAQPTALPVFMTSLDDALGSAVDPARVRLLKTDTEGAELGVLRGAARLLSEGSPLVICEINAFGMAQMGTDEQELRGYMRGLGYATHVFAPGTIDLTVVPDDEMVGPEVITNVVFRKEHGGR